MNGNSKEHKLQQYSIAEHQKIAKDVFVLGLQKSIDFTPGQVVEVTTSLDIPPRMYSICSGPNDKLLHILYNIQPHGLLTPKLSQLKPGESLFVSSPMGSFKPAEKDCFWIASGTGIAPFISQIQTKSLENVTLIHGAKSIEGFYFQERLKDRKDLDYIRCCSAENGEGIYSGRLTKYLKELDHLPKNSMYYLCGSPEMVVDTRDILIQKGIEYSNIASEIYF